MPLVSKILFTAASIIYPLIVFSCLVVFKVPLKVFSLFVVFTALLYMLFATSGKGDFREKAKRNAKFLLSAALLLAAGVVCLATGQSLFIKLYPVVMNGIFLFTFASTLFMRPNICFRFACLSDKKLEGSLISSRVERYCSRVTIVWCAFFTLNGAAAFATVLFGNDKIWSIYNGGISYALMGVLFAVEFFIRMVVNSKMPKSIPITRFNSSSRPMDTVICYERKWSDNRFLTWGDFLRDSAKMRKFIKSHDSADKWILHCEDYYLFLCSFVALLQCKKEVLLTANISPSFIAEIKSTSGGIMFLTDQSEIEGRPIEGAEFIPSIAEKTEVAEDEIMETPPIDSEETRIVMYTSGSTGHPKAVRQRMKEFEEDNAFIMKKWGDEFLSRKLCATVSQHHIYGFLFTISLPFSLAVPFRRKRIEFPEEFNSLDDEEYMIIAVPAFLKRTNMEFDEGIHEAKKLPLKNPWIFTSGGVLLPEVAMRTLEVFGFCPLEVYGSTETSGIAYRQRTKDGDEWTPFDNAKIWADKDDGCLTIISPYIKNPEGFKTGDLVDIHEDGRFILKGRADSIVKIEEKRISVVEVENRIGQTGLVADCCVVPMSDRRQYLAAAIVLNKDGQEKFRGMDKFDINKFFHDYLLQYFENVVIPKKYRYLYKIPCDVQGKKHKPEIQSLFSGEK